MKRLISVFIIMLLLITSMFGCAKEAPSEPAASAEPAAAAEPTEERVKPVEIILASFNTGNGVGNQTAVKFKELVEKQSEGKIIIKYYPDGSLGSELENLEQIKTNEIQMCYFGDNFGSQLAPQYDLSTIPFIFQSVEDVRKMYASEELGSLIAKSALEKGNVKLIGLSNRSPRNLTASKIIKTPADLKGLKIRVPEIPSWVTVWNSLGAMSTVVAWPETYSALQTGVVDGQENPVDNIFTNKIYEVNKYIMMTEHLQAVWHWCINNDFYNSLDPELQEILTKALKEACDYGDGILKTESEGFVKAMVDEGTEIIEVDKALFSDAAKPGIDKVLEKMSDEAIAYVNKYFDSLK